MKKIAIFYIIFVMLFLCNACTKKSQEIDKDQLRIGLFTTGDINDKSFNQTIYESCLNFVKSHNAICKHFFLKSSDNDTVTRSFKSAISENINIIILPGFNFTKSIIHIVANHPEVKFIAIDISAEDVKEFAPTSWRTSNFFPKNVYCCGYQEEIAGFLAGYATVKEGYTQLGFVGGKAVPAVVRYGYGFLQGVDNAATELGVAEQVSVSYVYSKNFDATENVTATVRKWYQDGIEVVFSCGGGIWASVCQSAKEYSGKVIGVDVDQSQIFNEYQKDMCVTCATKNLGETVNLVLTSIFDKTFETNFGGKSETLGIVSVENLESNFVGLPTSTWNMKKFTIQDYRNLVAKIYNQDIVVTRNIDEKRNFGVKIKICSNIK